MKIRTLLTVSLVGAASLAGCSGPAQVAPPPTQTAAEPMPGVKLWTPAEGTALSKALVSALNKGNVADLKPILRGDAASRAGDIITAARGKVWKVTSESSTVGVGPAMGVMNVVLNKSGKDIPLTFYTVEQDGRWVMSFEKEQVAALQK